MQIKPKVNKNIFPSQRGTNASTIPLLSPQYSVVPHALVCSSLSRDTTVPTAQKCKKCTVGNQSKRTKSTWGESGWQLQPSTLLQIHHWMRRKAHSNRKINDGESCWVLTPVCVRHFCAKQMSSTSTLNLCPICLPFRAGPSCFPAPRIEGRQCQVQAETALACWTLPGSPGGVCPSLAKPLCTAKADKGTETALETERE